MVKLTTVNWMPEADFLCTQLASYGIEAHIPDQNTASVLPLHGGALGGIRIMVHEDDLEKARAVLNDLRGIEKKAVPTCPHCSSDEVRSQPMSWKLAAFVVVMIGIPLLWLKREFRCGVCGHRWCPERPEEK